MTRNRRTTNYLRIGGIMAVSEAAMGLLELTMHDTELSQRLNILGAEHQQYMHHVRMLTQVLDGPQHNNPEEQSERHSLVAPLSSTARTRLIDYTIMSLQNLAVEDDITVEVRLRLTQLFEQW